MTIATIGAIRNQANSVSMPATTSVAPTTSRLWSDALTSVMLSNSVYGSSRVYSAPMRSLTSITLLEVAWYGPKLDTSRSPLPRSGSTRSSELGLGSSSSIGVRIWLSD